MNGYNPLLLDKLNREFYDAMLDWHATDIQNDFKNWRKKKHKIENMKRVHGRNIKPGWRCWFVNHNNWIHVNIAEEFSF